MRAMEQQMIELTAGPGSDDVLALVVGKDEVVQGPWLVFFLDAHVSLHGRGNAMAPPHSLVMTNTKLH